MCFYQKFKLILIFKIKIKREKKQIISEYKVVNKILNE